MDASPSDVANRPEMIMGGNKPRNVTLNESLPYANPLHDVLEAEEQLSVDALKGSGVVEDVSQAVKKVSKSKAAKKVGKVAKKVATKVLDEAQKSAGAAGAAGGVALATAIAQPELAPTLAVVGKKVAEAVAPKVRKEIKKTTGLGKPKRPPSKWVEHVKAYAAENNVSYKQSMSDARATYKK
jgi:hypothetical protein